MSAVMGVAVGLVFLVLLLSLLASAVVEGIAGIFRLRASMLERALRGLLAGAWDWERRTARVRTTSATTEALLADPALATGSPVTVPERVRTARTPGRPARLRSAYLAQDQFVDLVFAHYIGSVRPAPDDVARAAVAGAAGDRSDAMHALIGRLWDDAGGRVDVLRHRLGRHYDATMDRVSGWYRRRTRWMLFAVGVVLAVGFNVGLLSTARALWVDDAVRSSIGAVAARAQPSSDVTGDLATAGTQLRAVADDGLPIGWGRGSAPHGLDGWLAAVVGWLAMGVGVSFGAPFWFDVLGRFVNLRLAGPKPERDGPGDPPARDPDPVPVEVASSAPAPTDGPVRTRFEPAVHGFHFANDFVNKVPVPFHAMRLTTYGRCGGMVYAGLDLFRAGVAVPAGAELPAKESPLGEYLLKRLFDSWANASALRFVTWTLEDDETVARRTRAELATLYAQIDRGEPVPLGLISAREAADIGHNHQVLATGYERRGDGSVVVETWDNNEPDTVVTLTVPASGTGVACSRRHNPYRGFFVHTYSEATPPADLSTTV